MKTCNITLLAAAIMLLPALSFGTPVKSGNKTKQEKTIHKKDSDGLILVYKTYGRIQGDLVPSGKSTFYLTGKGTRMEVHDHRSGKSMSTNMDLTILLKADEPGKMFIVNKKHKAYHEGNLADMGSKKADNAKMDVLGTKKLDGYNCTLVKITETVNPFGKKEEQVTKLWLTKEIKGADKLAKLLDAIPTMQKSISKAVKKYGVIVKQTTNRGGTMIDKMELLNADHKSVPDEKFEIPNGYKKMGG